MAVDYLDFSTPDNVKMPPFQKIKKEYPKDLHSSVLFPEFTIKSTQNKGKPSRAAGRLPLRVAYQYKLLIFLLECSSVSYFLLTCS